MNVPLRVGLYWGEAVQLLTCVCMWRPYVNVDISDCFPCLIL